MKKFFPLLLFIFHFSLFTCEAQDRKVAYVDSVINYFNKAKTNSRADSLIFEKGIRLIDSIPADSNSINRTDKVADYFMESGKYNQYSLIKISLFYKLRDEHEYYKAIEYGKAIINEYDTTANPGLRDLQLLTLFELRVPYRSSDKLADGFDYFTIKLQQGLQKGDSAQIATCYYVLSSFYSTKGLNELCIYYIKKTIDYVNRNTSASSLISRFTFFTGKQNVLNLNAILGEEFIYNENYREALKYLRTDFDSCIAYLAISKNISGNCATNIVYAKLMLNETDSAEYYLNFSFKSFGTPADLPYHAVAYQIQGFYYLKINKLDSAEKSLNECWIIIDENNVPALSFGGILIPNYYLAQIRIKQKRFKEAIGLMEMEIPRLVNLRKCLLLEYKLLAEAYIDLGDKESANKNLLKCILLQEQLQNDEDKNRSMSYETEKKISDAENTISDLQTQKKIASISRNYSIGIAILLLVIAIVIFNRFRSTKKQKTIIEKEKRRSDELLLNILPSEVAEELKDKGSADAKAFDDVTVIFTDFKSFTAISEKLTAKELVAEIDYCFKGFDSIIGKYGIEKIKTIGDSYMAAGGLPVANKTHANDVVNAALEIVKFIEAHKQLRLKEGKPIFEIRIGINTGPVVAGIVGVKKFAYDIWGDTVNLASRMESSGEPGKVNISGSTYELVKNDFTCIYRGKIQAKNKGEVDMYFVN